MRAASAAGRRGTAAAARQQLRWAQQAAALAGRKWGVIGCGSNVVDRFFAVRALPKPGEKGFFQSPTKIQEGLLVGGVTLNHLAWASVLGCPAALMARQGAEDAGNTVRAEMLRCGVGVDLVDVSEDNTTSESYVFNDPSGERSIIMASGSTSTIDAATAERLWSAAPAQAGILSTEISQVPLGGVLQLLRLGAAAGALTVLDVDVSPSVAVDEAGLGSHDEVLACVTAAEVLKPARHAAEELLQRLDPGSGAAAGGMDGAALAAALLRRSGAKMVALTEGGDGCVVAMAGADDPIRVPAARLAAVRDATGAGDAFLGGLLAALYRYGRCWEDADPRRAAERAGRIANAAGAANCQALGGLPPEGFDTAQLVALDASLSGVIADLR